MCSSTTRRPTWVFGLLISLDQLMNATFWPLGNWAFKTDMFGWPDETMSSVLGKLRDINGSGTACRICRVLSWIDWTSDDHCKKSIEWDEGRRRL